MPGSGLQSRLLRWSSEGTQSRCRYGLRPTHTTRSERGTCSRAPEFIPHTGDRFPSAPMPLWLQGVAKWAQARHAEPAVRLAQHGLKRARCHGRQHLKQNTSREKLAWGTFISRLRQRDRSGCNVWRLHRATGSAQPSPLHLVTTPSDQAVEAGGSGYPDCRVARWACRPVPQLWKRRLRHSSRKQSRVREPVQLGF